MFDPSGAVFIECGDTFGERHELGAAFGGGRLHEFDDGLLGRPIVPRGQWVDGVGHSRRECNRANDEAVTIVCVRVFFMVRFIASFIGRCARHHSAAGSATLCVEQCLRGDLGAQGFTFNSLSFFAAVPNWPSW